jgi:hypothetical protein
MRTSAVVAFVMVWFSVSCAGLWRLFQYEREPGAGALTTSTWPANSRVPRPSGQPTLVVFIHPQCPCSRATIGELDQLMAECSNRLSVLVYVYRPKGFSSGWERTDLWQRAAAIPGVQVVTDVDGSEARKFGARTSGQTFLFDPSGRALFQGGITAGRGHAGDNAGRAAVVALVSQITHVSQTSSSGRAPQAESIDTPVYGCSLVRSADGAASAKTD